MLSLAYWEIPSSAKIAGISFLISKSVVLHLYFPKLFVEKSFQQNSILFTSYKI